MKASRKARLKSNSAHSGRGDSHKKKITREYPRTWDDVRDLPAPKAVQSYSRGIRSAMELRDRDFLITELHNPRPWRDVSRGRIPGTLPAHLIIACLPACASEAERLARQIQPKAATSRIHAFQSVRAFLDAWINFLRSHPPAEFTHFLRLMYWPGSHELERAARRIVDLVRKNAQPCLRAFRALEKNNLLETVGVSPEPEWLFAEDIDGPSEEVHALLDKAQKYDQAAGSPWLKLIACVIAPVGLTAAAVKISK